MNNPLTHIKLPRLSLSLEKTLIANITDKNLSYNKNTSCDDEKNAIQNKDLETLNKLDYVKQLYGIDYIPQHKMNNVEFKLIRRIESELGIKLPRTAKVYVQTIDSEFSFIHTDGLRKNSFFYLLSDNGDCETRFYTSENLPVYSRIWNPNEVKQFYSHKILPHNWYMFSHDTIHSVNNVDGLRITLIVDMSEEYPV